MLINYFMKMILMKSRLLTVTLSLLVCAMGVQAQRGGSMTGLLAGSMTQKNDKKSKNQKSNDFEIVNDAGIPIRYRITSEADKTAAVTGGKGFYFKVQDLSIPQTITFNGDSYTVTEIGEKAFGSIMWGGCRIQSIVLPPTITKISEEAFALCANLYSINLPEGLVEIGKRAFCGNLALTKLYIPNSVRRIDDGAFWHGITGGVLRIDLENLPLFVTPGNCKRIGLAQESVDTYLAYHPRTTQVAAQPQQQIVYVQQPAPVQQAPAQQPVAVQEQPKAPSSDVDVDIPQGKGGNENTFAIIFANENYQEEVNVDYALNDGEMFKTYCQKVLGLPEDNVHIRKDATLNNIKAEMTWLKKVADAYKGQARFIVYYAGHGIPDEKSGTSYLLPVDGKGSMLETGYSLKQFYDQLGSMPSAGVTVFMDACFSGSKRGEGMLASARGVAIKAKPQAPQGKMVVFSAAQGDETAYPFKEKEHGMFTYYLLKKLKETSGNVSLEELGQYVTDQVSRKSIVSNGKSQTPTIVPSGTMGEGWRTLKLK
jgi:hypothetical protein